MKVFILLAILHLSTALYILHVVEDHDLIKCIEIPGYTYSANESLEVFTFYNKSFTNLSYPLLPNGVVYRTCLMINLTNVQINVSGTYIFKNNRFVIDVINNPRCITNFELNDLVINDDIIITCKKIRYVKFMSDNNIIDTKENDTHIIFKDKLIIPVIIKLVYINDYKFIVKEFDLTDVLIPPYNMKCEPDGQYFNSYKDVKCTALGNPNPQITIHNNLGHIINNNIDNINTEYIYFMMCNRIRQKINCLSSNRMYKAFIPVEEINMYYSLIIIGLLLIWSLLVCIIIYYKCFATRCIPNNFFNLYKKITSGGIKIGSKRYTHLSEYES